MRQAFELHPGQVMRKSGHKRILVRDMMTEDPITASERTTVKDAIRILDSQEIRHLPILGSHGELVGMVTDRDLRSVTLPYTLVEDAAAADAALEEPISKVMSREPVTVAPDADIDDVMELLMQTKVGAIPVVEPRSRDVVGIVSYVDVLRELQQR
jgi:CBS domain-containing protein